MQPCNDYYGGNSSNNNPLLSSTQQTAEILTQNPESTQLLGDSQSQGFLSPLPESPQKQPQPWGRLVPCNDGSGSSNTVVHQLFPKPPTHHNSCSNSNGVDPQQPQQPLLQLRPSDIFNQHTLGRSSKCDVPAVKPFGSGSQKLQARQEWAFGMISNRHCQIYCCLDDGAGVSAIDDDQNHNNHHNDFAVYIEDCSGNGTTINQTVVLRKGEKRRLHSGDEICLVNRQTLQKKIRSATELQKLLQPYSYVFCLLPTTQQQTTTTIATTTTSLMAEVTGRHQQHYPNNNNHNPATTSSSSSNKKRKAAVNARATHQHRSPRHNNINDNSEASMFPLPQPRRHNNNNGTMSPLYSNNGSAEHISPRPGNNNSNNSHAIQRQQLPGAQHHHRQRYIQQDYDIRDVLGQGTVGCVRRAIHRATGTERAVKIIAPPRHFGGGGRAAFAAPAGAATSVAVEAEILRQLKHPYVVQLVDVYTSSSSSGGGNNGFHQQQPPPPPTYYLVMELMHGGDLFDRIVQKGRYSEDDARRVMRRLLNALFYLHERQNVVHRDLKPENILLTSKHDDISIKLTDFGLAKEQNSEGLKTFCGTPAYFAPEVLSRKNTVAGRGRYGKPADLWSLGVILYVLLTGMPPFDDDHEQAQQTVEFPNDVVVSAEAQDLVRQLLQPNPAKRWTVAQACEHPWILHDCGSDTHVHPLADPLWTEQHSAMADDEGKERPKETNTAAAAAAAVEMEKSTQRANGPTLDEPPVSAKVSGTAVVVAKSAALPESATSASKEEQQEEEEADSNVQASSTELKGESTVSPTSCEPAPAIESLDQKKQEPSDKVEEDKPGNEESKATPLPFPPLPPVFDTETTSKMSKQEKTRVQRVSAANYSFRPAQRRQSMTGIVISNNKKKQAPASPSPSSAQPHRRPLSPLTGNDEDSAGAAGIDNENSKKRSSVEGTISMTSSITPGTSSHARRAVPPSLSSSLPDPKQQPSKVSAPVVARSEEEDRLELSDDEILSRFSENTDSISSFSSTVAEKANVGGAAASKAPVNVDENNHSQVETAAGAATKNKKKAKSSTKRLAAATKATHATKSKKRKIATTTAKKSPSAKSKKEANGGGGGKQTTLNKWFKKND